MRALVAGALGCLGRNLVEHLIAEGDKVRALAYRLESWRFLNELRIEVVRSEPWNMDALKKAVKGVDVVYNCAAVQDEMGKPGELLPLHVKEARNVFEACVGSGVGRVVFLSSAAVYGLDPVDSPLTEDARPRPTYPQERARAEADAMALSHRDRLPIAVARPVTAVGKHDLDLTKLLFDDFVTADKVPLVRGGKTACSLISTTDVARALRLLGHHEAAVGHVYLFKGFDTTWQALLESLCRRMDRRLTEKMTSHAGAKLSAKVSEARGHGGGVAKMTAQRVDLLGRDRLFDDGRARRELGWEPADDLERTAEASVAWYRSLAVA